jgi:hypothetical protein
MKYCIDCSISSYKNKKFIGAQCDECYAKKPIPQVEYIRKKQEIIYKPKKERVIIIKEKTLKKIICKYCFKDNSEDEIYFNKSGYNMNIHVKCKQILDDKKAAEKKRLSDEKKAKKLEAKLFKEPPESKVCSKCGERKHIRLFYSRHAHCKKCHRKIVINWISKNTEKVRLYMQEYHKTYKRNK